MFGIMDWHNKAMLKSKPIPCRICGELFVRNTPKGTLCAKQSCKDINHKASWRRKNGWTEEKVLAYIAEQLQKAQP